MNAPIWPPDSILIFRAQGKKRGRNRKAIAGNRDGFSRLTGAGYPVAIPPRYSYSQRDSRRQPIRYSADSPFGEGFRRADAVHAPVDGGQARESRRAARGP